MVWVYAGFIAFVVALLALDLGVFHRHPHRIRTREALAWSLLWIAVGVGFTGVVYFAYDDGWGGYVDMQTTHSGSAAALAYLTSYVVEKSLAVDNIFVIALIFGYLRIPPKYQHRVLFWGIASAIVMRGAMIAAGAALVSLFDWILYVFGAFLVLTGIKTIRHQGAPFEPDKSRGIALMRRVLRIRESPDDASPDHGPAFVTRVPDGKLHGTTLLLALVVVEACDVMFAVDSIPAVFTVTQDPLLVFTSNIMAILGLRSLYFVLAEMLDRFVYLKPALGVVLALVGLKMLAHEPLHAALGDQFGWVTLAIVLSVLTIGVIASLVHRPPAALPAPDDAAPLRP
jgi:tellurite resistance protein TerC